MKDTERESSNFALNKLILPSPLQVGPSGEYKTTLMLPPFTNGPGSYDVEVWVDPVNTMHDSNLADNKISSRVTLVAESIKGATTGSTAPNALIKTVPSGAVPKIVPPKVVPRPLP